MHSLENRPHPIHPGILRTYSEDSKCTFYEFGTYTSEFTTTNIDTSCMPACMRAKSLQSHLTLCHLLGCSLPDSSVQARSLEWVAIPSSRESSWPRDQNYIYYVSCIGRWVLFTTSDTWKAYSFAIFKLNILLKVYLGESGQHL